MTKRVVSVLTSLMLLAISIVLLLVYFSFNTNKDKVSPLSLLGHDLSLFVGECVYNFYQVSNVNADITFSVNKEDIISIDKEKIIGLKAGQVEVTMIASFENQISKEQIQVTVYNNGYSYDILAMQDCEFQNNTLFVNGNVCIFELTIYDRLNNKLNDLNYKIETDQDVVINKNLHLFSLYLTHDCKLKFYYPEIDYSFEINVILI